MTVLPFPPSVNRMWRNVNGRAILSRAGRQYRAEAVWCARSMIKWGAIPVTVTIRAFMPDRRRRDIDNLLKAPIDAMTHAGVYDDDSQVRKLTIEHAGIDRDNPRLEVQVVPA